jgi:hypothetical protein
MRVAYDYIVCVPLQVNLAYFRFLRHSCKFIILQVVYVFLISLIVYVALQYLKTTAELLACVVMIYAFCYGCK